MPVEDSIHAHPNGYRLSACRFASLTCRISTLSTRIRDVELEGNTSEQALLDRQQWLEWSVRNYATLERLHQPPYGDRAIVLRSSGELIGACGLAPVLLPFAQIPALRPADVPPSTPVQNTSEIGLYWAISPQLSAPRATRPKPAQR